MAEEALPAQPQSRTLTPMELLAGAIERGVDLPMLEKLMELQERHERNHARKAFEAAIADAKAAIKPVRKNRVGHNHARYADFAAYAREIDPVLAQHGLSYRFRTRQDDRIHVSCVLSHREGHSEETTLSGAADTSGSKNGIQAIGSTLTYLQRYALCAALGLAADNDDDGRAAGGDEPITSEQLATLQRMVAESGADIDKLCAHLRVDALADLRQSQFASARGALEIKIRAKAKKLEAAQ